MNILSQSFGFLSSDFDVKTSMLEFVAGQRFVSLALALDNTTAYPRILKVHHSKLPTKLHLIQFGDGNYNVVLDVEMPCGESHLLWMPWLPHQTQPHRNPGEYQHISFGKWLLMPRRTRCYDFAYSFSGQTHPLEKETPEPIQQLYKETNSIFQIPGQGANMCLENDYDQGHQKISEHSDDERQFGELHDVFCWITGPAARPAIFRVKKDKKAVRPSLHQYCCIPEKPEKSRELFSIALPAGLYVMSGKPFQQRYTHEFPSIHENLFKRLVAAATKEWGVDSRQQASKRVKLTEELKFPSDPILSSKGAPMTALVQACWLKEHKQQVTDLLSSGKVATSRQHTTQQDLEQYEEWCLERTSYTLRNFNH